jgi:hypothetical protein
MPYIEKLKRHILTNGGKPMNSGELNFLITTLVREYWLAHGPKYQAINDIVGALESAKAEFQRRVVGAYEDQKIKDNGDVY